MPEKEDNNQKQKKEKECPLCKISEETLKKLKDAGENKKPEQKSTKDNEK